VRDCQIFRIHGDVAINQQVKVNTPRAPANCRPAIPTLPALYRQEGIQEINRSQPGQQPGHRVNELRLWSRANRRIPQAFGRRYEACLWQPCQRLQRVLHLAFRVIQIAA